MAGPDGGYIFPWAEFEPRGAQQSPVGQQALARLIEHFMMPPGQTEEAVRGQSARLNFAVVTYNRLLFRAAAGGLRDDAMKTSVLTGMKMLKLVDSRDPDKAEDEYQIISQGVELNRSYWEYQMERRRRFFQTLDDPTSSDFTDK